MMMIAAAADDGHDGDGCDAGYDGDDGFYPNDSDEYHHEQLVNKDILKRLQNEQVQPIQGSSQPTKMDRNIAPGEALV